MRHFVFSVAIGLVQSSLLLLNPNDFALQLGDDLPWAVDNIPFFECDDTDITDTYYFRWHSYKQHIVSASQTYGAAPWPGASANAYIVTEFTPNVSWAGKYNTIVDSAGHHIHEGRWLRDSSIVDDYSLFWYSNLTDAAIQRQAYTAWLPHSILSAAEVRGYTTVLTSLLPAMVQDYNEWVTNKYLGPPDNCFYQIDDRDAMEYSISGDGCRPTINSAMTANARAISTIAGIAGNSSLQAAFTTIADNLSNRIMSLLWNPNITSFAVYKNINPPPSSTYAASRVQSSDADASVRPPPATQQMDAFAAECPPAWPTGQLVQVRELLGLSSPWYWEALPKGDPTVVAEYAPAWAQLLDPQGFYGPWGSRTAERRHPCYNYSSYTTSHECDWDGPSWPFETSRLLSGLATMLQEYPPQAVMRPVDFYQQLAMYARAHTSSTAINGTRPWIGEDLHPDDGYWIAREIMYKQNASLRNRGQNYNHSTFVDLVIAGLLGLRAALGNLFTLNPLVSAADPSNPDNPVGSMSYFALDNLLYHGHNLSIAWDVDGSRYGRGPGLQVWCDSVSVPITSAPTLTNVTVDLSRCP